VGGSAVVDPLMAIVYAIAELLSLAWRGDFGAGEGRASWPLGSAEVKLKGRRKLAAGPQ